MNVEWRHRPGLDHFGSTEIKGGGAPKDGKIIYRHPTEPDGSISSPSASWNYSHANGATSPINALNLDLACYGGVSFDRYVADHAAYNAAGLVVTSFQGPSISG